MTGKQIPSLVSKAIGRPVLNSSVMARPLPGLPFVPRRRFRKDYLSGSARIARPRRRAVFLGGWAKQFPQQGFQGLPGAQRDAAA